MKEFFRQWRRGIKNITPIQFSWIQLQGIILIFIGACIGMYISFHNETWWLFLILLGTFTISITNVTQTIQKLIVLYEFADIGGKDG